MNPSYQGWSDTGRLLSILGGPTITPPSNNDQIYWPASANAAMADIIRLLFPTTSPANKVSIDSLETSFNTSFDSHSNADINPASAEFGKTVAATLFEWSKTDGGHEGFLPQPDTYVPPVGPGLWIPTPPAYGPASSPDSGNQQNICSRPDRRNTALSVPPSRIFRRPQLAVLRDGK